jgi:hypothetical protein
MGYIVILCYTLLKNCVRFLDNMGILDIFSKRNNNDNNSIFKYNEIPKALRIQIVHIWKDSIGLYSTGRYNLSPSNKIWDFLHKGLCKEYGIFSLSPKGDTSIENCLLFIQDENSVEKILDIIELSFKLIDTKVREMRWEWENMGITQHPDQAISELNQRFREHGIGYQYIEGQIVRVDSDYIYKEAVEPAVDLLFSEGFEGASEEFMKAHEHFRKGNDKEAVTEAQKAFESVMKTICNRMEWDLPQRATASHLITTLFKNELIPSNLQTQLNSLKTTLEGLPTVRNNNTGHGQGEKSVKIPRHLVAYALHLCATNIVFLIEAFKEKSK